MRARTARRLEEGEARFRALVEHAYDVISVLDTDGTIRTIRYLSPSVTQMLGYPDGSQAGTVVFDLVHSDDRDRVQSALQSLVDGGGGPEGPLEGEFRLAHADGSWRDVEATATNVADEPAWAMFDVRCCRRRREFASSWRSRVRFWTCLPRGSRQANER